MNVNLETTVKTAETTAASIAMWPEDVTDLQEIATAAVNQDGKESHAITNVMTRVMEEIAAIHAVNVKMEFLVTKQMDDVLRGVPLAMKEYTVTKHANISTMGRIAT